MVSKVARATTVAQVITDSNGASKKCIVSSANKCLDEQKINNIIENVKNSKTIILTDEYGKESTEIILKNLQNQNLNIIYRPILNVEIEKELYQNISYVVLNEEQLAFLTKMPITTVQEIKNASRELINYGVTNVIVTRGEQGAMAVSASFCKVVKGFKVDVIDTIAAGDCFTAGFVSAILEGNDIPKSVAYANAVGALTVTKRGAVPSICTKAQALQFLSKHIVIKK
jgi:ribokinase